MCYLGRGENQQEIEKLLLFFKKKLSVPPKSITVDYKPAWDNAIKRVFPNTMIIRDGFHTVQLINRAILKELRKITKILYSIPINETIKLYQLIKKDRWSGNINKFGPTNEITKEFKYYYQILVKLYKKEKLIDFKRELDNIFDKLLELNTKYSILLSDELKSRLPPNGLTEKNLKYYKIKLRAALSKVMRTFRLQLKAEKKEFKNASFLILKRDENLSEYEKENLNKLLDQFNVLKRYRELSLRISDIYHMPVEKLKEDIILDIKLWAGVGSEVETAVETLKKNVKEILNFRYVDFIRNKEMNYKKVRSTPEYSMRKIKKVVRDRYGLRTKPTTQLYLEMQLKCPVIIV